jgi:hypothetical protein
MPSIRIGLSTDFNLTNELVGINTTVPSVRLDVRGQILSQNTAGGSGISTLTTYDGFLDAQQRVTSNISIAQTTKGNLNSLSGEIILDSEITVTDGTPLTGGRLDSLTVTGAFDLPHGGTASRETTPEKGSTRFNQDLGQLEFYTGTEWRTTLSYDGSGRGRGVFGGGGTPTLQSSIEFINISSTGNSLDFGTLLTSNSQFSALASSIRGVFAGYGSGGSVDNVIQYITIASQSNAIDFGDLTVARRLPAACSSSTRGIVGGGVNPTSVQNVIDYITISTVGNALDFGDLTLARRTQNGSCASPTRGVFLGGQNPSTGQTNIIDFITIASTGNATDFGDSLFSGAYRNGCSNSVRGLFAGGTIPASVAINTIEFLTISSTGNSVYFGDLTVSRHGSSSASSSTRALWCSGSDASSSVYYNTIDYVSISSSGNAQDFGDLAVARVYFPGLSDSHGGLGGF